MVESPRLQIGKRGLSGRIKTRRIRRPQLEYIAQERPRQPTTAVRGQEFETISVKEERIWEVDPLFDVAASPTRSGFQDRKEVDPLFDVAASSTRSGFQIVRKSTRRLERWKKIGFNPLKMKMFGCALNATMKFCTRSLQASAAKSTGSEISCSRSDY